MAIRQTSCKHCGHDVEGSGRDWRDRGNDTRCPKFCGYNEDGVPIYRKRRNHQPQPLHGEPTWPTRHAPDRPGRPRLTGG